MNCSYFRNLRAYLLCLSVFLLALFQATPAVSRIYIDINSPLQKKIPIAIPSFRYEGGDGANQSMGKNLADMEIITLDVQSKKQSFEVPVSFVPDVLEIDPRTVLLAQWDFKKR